MDFDGTTFVAAAQGSPSSGYLIALRRKGERSQRWLPEFTECRRSTARSPTFRSTTPRSRRKGGCRFRNFWAFLCYSIAHQVHVDADDTAGAMAVDRITAQARERADPPLTPVAATDKLDAVLSRLDADPSADRTLVDELERGSLWGHASFNAVADTVAGEQAGGTGDDWGHR